MNASPPPAAAAPSAATSRGGAVRIVALVGLIAAAALAAWRLGFFGLRDPRRLAAFVEHARAVPAIAPLFVAVYAVVAAFGLPATPLTLAGGAIFGTVLGSVLNWAGAVLGGAGSWLLAHALGEDAFRRLLGRWSDKLGTLDARSGLTTVFRLRLVPVVPCSAAGLASVPFRAYVLGTALGIVPGTVIYTYFADSLIAGVAGASHAAFVRVGIAAALLLLVSFAPAVVRRARGSAPAEYH